MIAHKNDSLPFAAVVSAPGFALGVTTDEAEGVVTGIRFLPPTTALMIAQTPLAAKAVFQLCAWLKDTRFVFDLPMRAQGTEFQQRVWDQIRQIPPGETRTYDQLARALDTSPRPVGGACGANPLPVLVPCHRVVASDGSLGGFAHERDGFFLEVKRWLLRHEEA